MFKGRVAPELFKEYQRWLFYIVDIFLPIVDSENGDLRTMPFPGSISQQPYMSMQIVMYIREQYKKVLSSERKKMLAKTQSPSHARRPTRRRPR